MDDGRIRACGDGRHNELPRAWHAIGATHIHILNDGHIFPNYYTRKYRSLRWREYDGSSLGEDLTQHGSGLRSHQWRNLRMRGRALWKYFPARYGEFSC